MGENEVFVNIKSSDFIRCAKRAIELYYSERGVEVAPSRIFMISYSSDMASHTARFRASTLDDGIDFLALYDGVSGTFTLDTYNIVIRQKYKPIFASGTNYLSSFEKTLDPELYIDGKPIEFKKPKKEKLVHDKPTMAYTISERPTLLNLNMVSDEDFKVIPRGLPDSGDFELILKKDSYTYLESIMNWICNSIGYKGIFEYKNVPYIMNYTKIAKNQKVAVEAYRLIVNVSVATYGKLNPDKK